MRRDGLMTQSFGKIELISVACEFDKDDAAMLSNEFGGGSCLFDKYGLYGSFCQT